MSTRRNFLKQTGLLTGGLIGGTSFLHACTSTPKRYAYLPGLQLYTVREAMEQDPVGTLSKVAQVGYQSVEAATYTGTQKFYGMNPNEFSSVLKKAGLVMPSGHYMLGNEEVKGTILNGWEQAVEDANEAGMKYMVCAYLTEEERKGVEGYKQLAEQFNKAGETCKKAGIQFCYHNHAFEFEETEGQIPYDILLSDTDKELVKMEMDIYWITYAGRNPLTFFKENPDRFILWHVKDLADNDKKDFTEVGNGVIDWPNLFAHAKEAGLKEFFVEQDQTPGDPFVSIEKSFAYLEEKILK